MNIIRKDIGYIFFKSKSNFRDENAVSEIKIN